MSYKILSSLFLIAAALSLISCSDDPSSIGSAFLKGDFIGLDSLDSYKDTLPQVSSTYQHSVPLGFSSTLLLGKKGNNTATMLMSFNVVFPDSIKTELLNNTLQVTNAYVQLYKNYTFGDSTSNFDFTAHKINNTWTSEGFTIDSLPVLQYGGADVSSNKTFSDTMYQFNVDNNLVLSWLNTSANSLSDNGIVLIPSSNTQKIVGFYALTSASNVDIPFITVVLSKPGVYIDTLKFSTTADLSVVSGIIPPNQNEYIYVQSSVELESKLKFDLSKVPQHAIINYAELDVTIDTTKSLFGNTLTDQLSVNFTIDSTVIDSAYSTIALNRSASGPFYTANITSYVQTWLSTRTNLGMRINATTYDTGTNLWAIYGSNASDKSKRPRLKIIYTNKK